VSCSCLLVGLSAGSASALSINPTFVDGGGETWDATRMGVVNQAITDWELVIGDSQTVNVTFDFTNAGGSGYLGQWQASYSGIPAGTDLYAWTTGMDHAIHFNADRFGGGNPLWWDPTPLDGSDQLFDDFDALSVARHEIGHLMGFTDGFYERMAGTAGSDKWTDENIIAGVFDSLGLNVTMAGSGNGHVADAGSSAGDLMVPTVTNSIRRDISTLDLDMLELAYGYTIIPESSTAFLLSCGLVGLGFCGRKQGRS